MKHKAPETCEMCIFYQPSDNGDIGTCAISDNIVEPLQEACNNLMNNN